MEKQIAQVESERGAVAPPIGDVVSEPIDGTVFVAVVRDRAGTGISG